MKQPISKILVFETSIADDSQLLPIEFSFLLPSWVSSVVGYELFFEPYDKKVGKLKMKTTSLELSLTIDNYAKHVIHDIVEATPEDRNSQAYIEPIYFEHNSTNRITGFVHSPQWVNERLTIKLFLIVSSNE